MKISEQWLREWLDLDISRDDLIRQLTMAGLEVDSVTPVAQPIKGIVVGEVLSIAPHPDADKLRVCQVNVGQPECLQIVCGAKNVAEGMRVPVAMVGAILGPEFKIKRAKLRGVESFGMICSESELGMAETSSGIFPLPLDAPLGEDINHYLHLNDVTIDIDLTPNRGDCLGMEGVAREVAAINRVPFKIREVNEPTIASDETLTITLTAKQNCPRYVGRVIRNVDMQATTPLWMKERLRRSGVRSIDPVVDVTNYVLIELGQPMHAFDLDCLSGGVNVRKANPGENLTLLDGNELTLKEDVLVIADQEKALAMAGVMGGLDSSVTPKTKHVFLESAHFAPRLITGKARHYGLHTDSSHRFERGVDPALALRAMNRATELLLSIVGGEAGPAVDEVVPGALAEPIDVTLRKDRIKRVLGVEINDADVTAMMTGLGLSLLPEGDSAWIVTVPTYRSDITLEEDLIEEVGRLYGYDRIPSHNLSACLQFHPVSEEKVGLPRFRQLLVDRDYQEAICYSFVDPKLQALFEPEQSAFTLLNPISSDLSVMRTSLLPGLVAAAKYNQNRQQSRIRLFESGLRFVPTSEGLSQNSMLAGVCAGDVDPPQWGLAKRALDFFDVKADVEALLNLAGGPEEVKFEQTEHSALHPGQSAKITRGSEVLGFVGALNPKIIQSLGLKKPIFVFELFFQGLEPAKLPRFATLSKYPAIRRDVAVWVSNDVPYQTLKDAVRSAAGSLLVHLELFDLYEGKGDDDGKKSLALGLVLQDTSRTLVDADVNELMTRVVDSLERECAAKLRD